MVAVAGYQEGVVFRNMFAKGGVAYPSREMGVVLVIDRGRCAVRAGPEIYGKLFGDDCS